MSHITKIGLQIKDLDALDKACRRLGLSLIRGQRTHKWYGRFVGDSPGIAEIQRKDYGKCEHAIKVNGNAQAYEIGLVRRADGKGYEMVWDSWKGGFGLAEATGYDAKDTKATKLRDWYAAEVARKQMARQGFTVTAKQLDRKVQVLCSK